MGGEIQRCSMNLFRSYKHEMYTISIDKVGLSPYDDKRYVKDNGVDTWAHGHYQTLNADCE